MWYFFAGKGMNKMMRIWYINLRKNLIVAYIDLLINRIYLISHLRNFNLDLNLIRRETPEFTIKVSLN